MAKAKTSPKGKTTTKTKASAKKSPTDGSSYFQLSLDEIKDKLAALIKENSIFDGDFILPSGSICNQYLDLSEVLMGAEGGLLASLAVLHKLEEVDFIGGAAPKSYLLSAISQIAYTKSRDFGCFRLREQPRNFGYSRWIEGPLLQTSRVALVQDLVVDGLDLLESIRLLQDEARAEIVQVIAIVDRGEGAIEKFAELGIDYSPVLTIDRILDKRK